MKQEEMDEEKGIIICPSCGGSYGEDLAKCPYCGTLNLPGAEQEYMDKLGDLRDDMEKLEQVPVQELKEAVKESGAFLKKVFSRIFLIAVILVLFLGGLFAFRKLVLERMIYGEPVDEKEELLWQQENFSRLDALYEQGAYGELVKAYQEAVEEGHVLWKWKHSEFCNIYGAIEDGEQYLQEMSKLQENEKYHKNTCSLLLYNEWKIFGMTYNRELSDEEREILTERGEALLEDFQTRWGFDGEYRENYEEMKQDLTDNGVVSFKKVEKFVKEWYQADGAEKK